MPVGHFPLQDKIVVITGGGSGICFSFAQLALTSGARGILICDLQLTPAAQDLINQTPDEVHFMKCDVTDWNDLEAIPPKVEEAFGKGQVGDVWIAGAGVFEPKWSSFIYDEEKEGGYKAMRINAEHPIKLTRIAMRSAISVNKPCAVLIVSSGAGITGQYAAALYCATKHAVVGFTKSMGQADIDENCKIVCILPGMVSTPLWTGRSDAVASQFSYTDEVCITPEDVAQGMKEMIEEEKYPGGSLMSIAKGKLRNVLESKLAFANDGSEIYKQFESKCYAPIREIWNGERGTKLS
ncbi:hypothetical protein M409DRAFT_20821 [Zasmidium cellare ATCC 36951]|uniref:NAD(P)-binding protein n=1 Tax=Zasmidium cellare ATCC 36951 TaxID=1080233 RepID=A0A6A6CNU8_ZASCE|nr:uncharacterized protein M409DRAFT_20821 [Zasmidium cellare ATCC 36951]KAF2168804.1 hypothetical protein M409DRAFT_20821 [Zasmidium cellare ATCC 36951]